MEVEVREATVQDIGAVQRVARVSWADAYRDIIPEDARDRFLERGYSGESLVSRMSSGAFVVVESGGEVVGFADFHVVSEEEITLAAIYVLPNNQGEGTGTLLLEAGLSRTPSASRVSVEVESENAVARRFYESRGFMKTGERTQSAFGYTFHDTLMVLQK